MVTYGYSDISWSRASLRGLPAFLENLSEDRSAVAVLRHDRTVPPSIAELVLAFVDGEPCAAGDRHRRAGVLADQFELAAGQRVDGWCQEQVRLRAQRIWWHHLTSVGEVPATLYNTSAVLFSDKIYRLWVLLNMKAAKFILTTS